EVKAMIPDNPKAGDMVPVPRAVEMRLMRFHLIDNTRGEPPAWQRNEVRSHEFKLVVESVTTAQIKMTLTGSALLASESDPAKAKRGFDAKILGHLSYDRFKRVFDRFDIVAVGDHWGESTFTR